MQHCGVLRSIVSRRSASQPTKDTTPNPFSDTTSGGHPDGSLLRLVDDSLLCLVDDSPLRLVDDSLLRLVDDSLLRLCVPDPASRLLCVPHSTGNSSSAKSGSSRGAGVLSPVDVTRARDALQCVPPGPTPGCLGCHPAGLVINVYHLAHPPTVLGVTQ